jgi:outer membrane protein assembly factor BamB
VPTGIGVARGSIYVSTLGSEAPGAARIYRLNPHDGRVVQTWGGLTGLTGVAVAPDGTVFASQVFEGAPQTDGPPPPGFDPSTVGQIVRIQPNGRRTHAQVTMPTGLTWHDGKLYASAWSVASFMGMQHAGQVVHVHGSAFR